VHIIQNVKYVIQGDVITGLLTGELLYNTSVLCITWRLWLALEGLQICCLIWQ